MPRKPGETRYLCCWRTALISDPPQVATRLSTVSKTTVKFPSYDQVRREVHRFERSPEQVAVREQAKSIPRVRESLQSFALSIPSPVLLAQVDEQSMELYVVTPDGITVASYVHAAVLICVKTATILARSWLWNHSRRRSICAWSSKRWKGKSV